MPMYEYTCKKCKEEFEELVSLSETVNPPCPRCHSDETAKKISRTGGIGIADSSGSCVSSGFS